MKNFKILQRFKEKADSFARKHPFLFLIITILLMSFILAVLWETGLIMYILIGSLIVLTILTLLSMLI